MENEELHPKEKKKRSKKTEYRKIRVNLYLTEQELTDYAEEAARVGLRPKWAKITTQKKHGFPHEQEANTKGIAKFIRKFLFPSWKRSEAERLIMKQKLEKEAEKLGLKVE